MSTAIQLQEISKSFDGGKTYAVRGVDLEVGPGELLVLLGASGCGKTTTLKMINRLADPTKGRVLLGGVDVARQDPVQLRRRIGYVFQSFALFPHMTVEENIGVVPRLLRWPEEKRRARAAELLRLVGLEAAGMSGRYPGALSGGQQQRVGFARALAAEPSVMLLDEPFGALDPITRDGLQEDFRRLRRELGLTAVMVTHDMTEALLLADRIAVMEGGQVLQVGTPRELLASPAHSMVEALLATPRRQADAVEAMIRGTGAAP